MIKIVIRILYWCTLIKPSLAVDASLTNITLIVKDYWSKFQRQKKSLKKGPSSRTLLANVGKQTPFGYFATSERTYENISRTPSTSIECLRKLLLQDIRGD